MVSRLALTGFLACLLASPAAAALQLCNRTSYVLYAAVGVQQSAKIVTRGWTRLVPGSCATAIEEPLKAPAYFVYARSSPGDAFPRRDWGGQFRFCVKDGNFTLHTSLGASDCRSNGVTMASFAPAPTGGARAWTMTLTEDRIFASADEARRAGLQRFLDALGYGAGVDSKSLDAALAKFRARAKLPANADLFAALEAQSKNVTPPAGYSICNDGKTKIWAALGFKSGESIDSRGWWEIDAGGCTVAIGQPLGRDPVYLYASRHGNSRLVGGPEAFCISNAAFDIRGSDRCAARGYAATGFLATNLSRRPGFVARIGDNGLAAAQPLTPK